MRPIHVHTIILALATCFACVSPPPEAVLEDFSSAQTAETAGYVKAMKVPVSYREIIVSPIGSPERVPLTPEQAREDIETLKYLLDTAYSGRDYWEMRGVDFKGIYDNLQALVAGQFARAVSDRPFSNWDLEERIATLFSSITDNHLCVTGRIRHSLSRHNTAFFADVLVEKRGDGYFVIDSGVPAVAVGARYSGPADSLFRTLSPADRDHFLAGALSYTRINKLSLSFDGAPVEVPVHTSRVGRIAYQNARDYIKEDVDGVPLLSVCSFEGKSPDAMRQFIDAGADIALRQSAQIMLDLRENCGGSRAYPQRFLSNLYQVSEFQAREIRQFSPAIVDATLADSHFLNTAANLKDESPAVFARLNRKYRQTPYLERALYGKTPDAGSSFQGKIIYLIDRRTGSAAEIATMYARASKNNIIVGENSEGAMTFGNVRNYQLKNSRIILSLPSSIVIAPGFRETEGFHPDYWIDSDHPEQEVVRWLHDSSHYRFAVQKH